MKDKNVGNGKISPPSLLFLTDNKGRRIAGTSALHPYSWDEGVGGGRIRMIMLKLEKI